MRQILALTIIAVITLGCISGTRYVCPGGDIAAKPEDCHMPATTTNMATPTTTQAATPATPTTVPPTTTIKEGPCSKLQTFEGSVDYAEYNRCIALTEKSPDVCEKLPIRATAISEENAFDQIDCYTQLAFQERDIEYCNIIQGNLGTVCRAITTGNEKLCNSITVASLRDFCKNNVRMATAETTGQDIAKCADNAFCIAKAARTKEDCNRINEQKNMNEQTLCIARTMENSTICDRILDPILKNICIREAIYQNGFDYRH